MTRIRIGVIGSGGMAAHRADRFRETEGFELAALLARNPETGPALAGRLGVPLCSDVKDLLSRVDAVAVCTHNESHAGLAIAALESDRHVFTEYPVARSWADCARLRRLARTSGPVLRVAHEAAVSASQKMLRETAASLGDLLVASFVRLTPGRGRRPEVLFNLPVSGPPALFFVYHLYPLVDLFGPAAWVEANSKYLGLTEAGRYDRFANAVTVGFERGGIGGWTWAGGVEIHEAEEYQRIVLAGGTLIRDQSGWHRATTSGRDAVTASSTEDRPLETWFREDVRGRTNWTEDLGKAFDATEIGLMAEASMAVGGRVDRARMA